MPATMRTVLPAGIDEFFLPGATGSLEPVLYGAARVHYLEPKHGVDVVTDLFACAPLGEGPVPVQWDRATLVDAAPADLSAAAPADAMFPALPAAAQQARKYTAWREDFEQWVARSQPLRLLSVRSLKMASAPGESERDFLARVQQARREQRDAAVGALRQKYAVRIERLEGKLRQSQDAVAREQQQASHQKLQAAVSVGATILGALLGRKAASASTLGRATTAARSAGRVSREAEDVARAEARAVEAETELQELRETAEAEVRALAAEIDTPPDLDVVEIRPRRNAVDVQLVALAWR
jgi:hypothetical protein